jgi:uncharacterized protein
MTGGRRPLRFAAIAFAFVVTLALTVGAVSAQELPTLADKAVNDFANVVDTQTEAEIDRWVRSLIKASKDYVYVVTVDTFAPFGSIEDYAVRLFERAKIGTRAGDNGVLIVMAVKDRRVRIETGYGLEGFITDGFAGDTIRQEMLPEFREGRYGQGLLNGTSRVVRRIAEGRGVSLTDIPEQSVREIERQSFPSWVVPLAIVIVFLILRSMSRGSQNSRFRRRRGGTWSGWHGGIGGFGGGGFGGGFGGFGGGGFGGGGGGGLGGFGGGRSGGGGASGGW